MNYDNDPPPFNSNETQLFEQLKAYKMALEQCEAELEKAQARVAELALVPAADVVTPEERAILRECEALDDDTLHAPIVHADMFYRLCDAIQRARREGI